LRAWADDAPDDPAVIGPTTTLSAGELWDTALRLVSWLRSTGVSDREALAFAVPDEVAPACVIALLLRGGVGASYVRGVPVGADAIISRVLSTEAIAGVPEDRRIRFDADTLQGMAEVDVSQVKPVARPAGSPAWLIFTSGTTGVPKAIGLSESQLWARLEASTMAYPPGTRFTTMFGLGSLGAQIGFLGSLRDRKAHIVPGPPRWRLEIYRERGITMLAGSPQQFVELLEAAQAVDERLPGLSRIILGGAPPSEHLIEALAEWFGVEVWDMYGSTEAHVVAARRLDGGDGPAFILPSVEVQIVGEQDQPLPDGEVGALRVRTPTMAAGYIGGDADAPQHGFSGGWFYPGDLASRSGAELRLAGRADDLINLGGSKVRPERIESAVRELPGVRDAGAVSIDDRFGNPMIAVGVVSDHVIDATELTTLLRDRFAALAPQAVVRLASLPRTETGKLRRGELAQQLRSRLGSSAAEH
jgi:acyl-coenzyme A synthetase/AMP-(fatty) acid ligase